MQKQQKLHIKIRSCAMDLNLERILSHLPGYNKTEGGYIFK